MTKKLKELIENAERKPNGLYDMLLIVPNGIYTGIWGKNGFDNILLLGYERKTTKWCVIAEEQSDKLDIENLFNEHFELDIPSDYKVPRIWFRNPIRINYNGISSIVGEVRRRNDQG